MLQAACNGHSTPLKSTTKLPLKAGQRWQILTGRAEVILPTLPDASVDMVFSDPPYGHRNNARGLLLNWEVAFGRGSQQKGRPIMNDGPEADDLFSSLVNACSQFLKPGSCACVCCSGGGGIHPTFARWSMHLDRVLEFVQMVVWDKGPMGMGIHYRRSYETVLVAKKPGGKMRWFDDSHRIENVIRPGAHGVRKIIPSKRQHPTEKPEALAAHFIRLHTRPGDLVLDPFCGSGSTGLAALKLGRRFIGIDCDSRWTRMARAKLRAACTN